MGRWPRRLFLKFCTNSTQSGETLCAPRQRLSRTDWLPRSKTCVGKLSPSRLTTRASWFKRYLALKSSWPSRTSNLKLKFELAAKRTLNRQLVTSSTETRTSSDQSDSLKLSESKRNNLKSKTKSYAHVLKPTSRIDRTHERMLPTLP